MSRFTLALLLLSVPTATTLAEDDEWIGRRVFPRGKETGLVDRDGKLLMKWSAIAGKVTAVEKNRITIRLAQYPGPYEFYVEKSEVVKLADAPQFFTDMILANQKDPWALSRRGEAWALKKEYDKAIKDLSEAITLDASPLAYILRGRAFYLQQNYDKAILDFDEAIRLDPKCIYAFNCRGLVWHQKDEKDKAIADFNQAIRLDPKYAYAFGNRADVWNDRNEFDEALKDFNEAIRLDPHNAETYCSRSVLLYDKKEYDEAIEDLTKAIELDSKSATAFRARGSIWLEKKDYDRAIRDFDESIRLHPKLVEAIADRALARYKKADFDGAIQDNTLAIAVDPTYFIAFNNRGLARQAKREYRKAIEDYTEAIRLNPKYAFAFNNRGNAWLDSRQHDKALADYSEAIRLDPKFAMAYRNRAGTQYALSEFDKAIEDLDQAIKLEPKDALSFVGRGLARNYNNQFGKAIEDFAEAIRLDPKNAEGFKLLARLLATCPDGEHRDGKRAVELATKGCELTQWKDPGQIDALATAYAESGDFERAVKFQKQAIGAFPKGEENLHADYLERLRSFEQKQPYREPNRLPITNLQTTTDHLLALASGNVAFLLANEAVQVELKMTAEQVDKVRDWTKGFRDKAIEIKKGKGVAIRTPIPSPEERLKLAAADAEIGKLSYRALSDILKIAQIERLKQIDLQNMGIGAFTSEDVISALKLTDQQKTSMKGLYDDAVKATNAIVAARLSLANGQVNQDGTVVVQDRAVGQGGTVVVQDRGVGQGGGGRDGEGGGKASTLDALKKAQALRKDYYDKAVALLTDDQKKKWHEMTGEPFDLGRLRLQFP